MNKVQGLPKVIKKLDIINHDSEFFKYQYLPIKLPNISTAIEFRLIKFIPLIKICYNDYIELFGIENTRESYIYLTAKCEYQRGNCGFNRKGWHIDGYMSDDINYIWSSNQPTIFNSGEFNLSEDHHISQDQMLFQAKEENNVTYPNETILRLDNKCVHKVGNTEEGVRTFVKITFSKNKFNLKGNSHNYLLAYDWEMFDRLVSRNHPNYPN
jgi:hypothetical protein